VTTPQADAPQPVISVMDSTVAAGQSVFVNAVNSNLVSGDWIHARAEWDFGDLYSQYNKLTGFNAAHNYQNAGTYTVTLKLTNGDGKSAVVNTQVVVSEASRKVIYVSNSGNDANSGLSPNEPIQTFARATQLVGDNTEVLFASGQTYYANSHMFLGYSNVVVGAYGNGDRPVLKYTSPLVSGAQILQMNAYANQVAVRDITYDSIEVADYQNIAQAVGTGGTGITVRD